MRFTHTFMGAVAAAMLVSTPALAAERREVPANKTTGLAFIYASTSLGHGCRSTGRGKFRISKPPKHGRVHAEWRKIKGDFHRGCKGTEMNGLAIWYTPNKGYRGDDAFSVIINNPDLYTHGGSVPGKNWSFKLDVK